MSWKSGHQWPCDGCYRVVRKERKEVEFIASDRERVDLHKFDHSDF